MSNNVGMKQPLSSELPRIKDRMTFLYLEKCRISKRDSAIAVFDEVNRGNLYIPAAAVAVLLLGPGVNVTHDAMTLICSAGVSMIWVGEHGVRYYAGGRALSRNTKLLLKQAEMVSNQNRHLETARRMYGLRFPGEDFSHLNMAQLRGREGSRVRKLYRDTAKNIR